MARLPLWMPMTMLSAGLALTAISLVTGQSRLLLVVIIPVIEVGGWIGLIGVSLTGASLLLLMFRDVPHGEGDVSGIVFLGPIPIVIGGRSGWIAWVAIAVIALLALALLLQYP